ncbi:MAG: 50S ribosomal protein L29 [Candidatus Nanohaloarchaea archaeon]
MAILTTEEIRNMDETELKEKMTDLKKELIQKKGQSEVGGFVDNPGRIKEMRKTIARIKTILNENSN